MASSSSCCLEPAGLHKAALNLTVLMLLLPLCWHVIHCCWQTAADVVRREEEDLVSVIATDEPLQYMKLEFAW